MMRRCSNSSCFVHDNEQCAEGKRDLTECPSWNQTESKTEEKPTAPAMNAARVPWSGSTLGLSDLSHLVPRGRSILIGVLGAHDSGKTTLLTANYLLLHRGATPTGSRFVGSRTLGAWEGLAASMRFGDGALPATFPAHTSRGTSRVPGLLHLALRGPDDTCRDVLLADAPGEWFTAWSNNENAPEAAGARWVEQRADAFLLLADCERLSGENRGVARQATLALIERLGNRLGKRPCALVWAKDDCAPSERIRVAIQTAARQQLPSICELGTSVKRPDSFVRPLEEMLRSTWMACRSAPIVEPVIENDPFSAFRGFHAPA